MSNTPIELKGSSFTLSVVHLHEAEPKVIHQALEDKIAQAPAFLKHAPVVLNVSALEDPVNWSAMHKAVSATGLRVIGVSGCKDAQLKAEIDLNKKPASNHAWRVFNALSILVSVDKDNLQDKQQRNDDYARAKVTQTSGTNLHHAVGDKAQRDTFSNREAERHHHSGNKRRNRFSKIDRSPVLHPAPPAPD